MLSFYKQIHETEKSEDKAALCIITQTKGSTPRKIGTKMIVFENMKIIGTIGGGVLEVSVIKNAIEVLKTNKAKLYKHELHKHHKMECGGYVEIYIEPIVKKNKLYIFGGGHIGKILAKYAIDFSFEVTIIDERKNIFDEFVDNKINLIKKNHNIAFSELRFDNNTYIASISHTHKYDKEIVAYCAKQNHRYLGMIGSNRKIEKIKNYYLSQKILTSEDMSEIDWPMGISIKCETPREIAISIMAKLIDIK